MMLIYEIESPKYKWSAREAKFSASRQLLVASADVDEFFMTYGGRSFRLGDHVVNYGAALFPGKPWLAVIEIDAEPFQPEFTCGADINGLAISKNGYKISVTYETPEYVTGSKETPKVPADTYLTVSTDVGANILAVPNNGLEWELVGLDNTKKLQEQTQIGAFEPTQTINMTWHQVPFPPWTKIKDTCGTVNKTAFMDFEPETVMFCGCQASRKYQLDGAPAWEVAYKFSVKRNHTYVTDVGPLSKEIVGWNSFFRPNAMPGSKRYQYIYTKGTTEKIYRLVEMLDLFKLEVVTP